MKINEKKLKVPIEIFSNRNLSILESVVVYLKEKGMKNSQISKVLGKNQNNIWTIYHRSKNKLNSKT